MLLKCVRKIYKKQWNIIFNLKKHSTNAYKNTHFWHKVWWIKNVAIAYTFKFIESKFTKIIEIKHSGGK